ncbi:hypothetical protein GCM10009123_16640 [Kangiella japonica]|uniref:Uncharacterized protein n=1 Tax=Kangiella japonica TaxID=647384 RepID=A0ABN0T1Y6_9GAMM
MSNDMNKEQDTKQKLTKAYQEASNETTSSELDASIMALAQQELESRQAANSKGSWWTRLKLPVSMAAALVVTIGIARFMVELGYGKPEFAESYSAESVAGVNATTVVLQDNSFTEHERVSAAPAKKEQVSQRQALEQREQEMQQLAVVGARVQREEVQRAKRSQQAERDMAYLASAAEIESKQVVQSDETMAMKTQATELQGNHHQPMPEAVKNAGSREVIDTPYLPAKEWLKNIESLLDSGEKEKAKEQWEKFKKIYPDFPIETPKKQRLEQN